MAVPSPRFALRLGGLQADTAHAAGGPSYFAVERSLDVPADGMRVWLAERGSVQPGDAAELELGDEDGTERVFTGTVAEVRPRPGGTEVFAVGTMLGLLELRTSSFYQQQSAGDVARDLIGQAGLDEGDISDGLSLPRFAVHRRLPAYPQLQALARRLGYDLFSDREGKIHFRGLGAAAGLDALGGGPGGGLGGAVGGALGAPGGGGGALAYGEHLVDARAAVRPVPGRRVVVGGESPMSGQGEDKSFWLTAADEEFEDSAGDGDEVLVTDPLARTKDMAGRFAAGYLAGLRRRTREVRLTMLGRGDLDLGDPLQSRDAPDELLNGSGYVRALRHRFGARIGFLSEAVVVAEEGG
jgi:hypothetical protein